jgi:hypothetical protein
MQTLYTDPVLTANDIATFDVSVKDSREEVRYEKITQRRLTPTEDAVFLTTPVIAK